MAAKRNVIKNYTSSVNAKQSRANIMALLEEHEAVTRIMVEKGEPGMFFIFFNIKRGDLNIPYRLPCDISRTYKALSSFGKTTPDQAERTAWKNLHEMVHHMLTLAHLQMVDLHEAFMPYAFNEKIGKTLYQLASSGSVESYNQLASGK